MNGTMHIENIISEQTNVFIAIPTKVKYTQESGLSNWEGVVGSTIIGRQSSPYYTSQIPNFEYAEEVELGSVSTIGERAFQASPNLKKVSIPIYVQAIEANAFRDCAKLTAAIIPNNVTSIGDEAFRGCISMETLVIGNKVRSIGAIGFYNCKQLKEVVIPDSVVSIGDYGFNYCTGMEKVKIGQGLQSSGVDTFAICSELTSLTLPDNLTKINKYFVRLCGKLKSITFGQNVNRIEENAFVSCTSLMVLDFRKVTTVPTLVNVNAFGNTSSNKEIIVPDSLYNSWIAASNWSSSTNNIVNRIVKASQSSLGTL